MPDLDDRIRGALTALAPDAPTTDPLGAARRRHTRHRQRRAVVGSTLALAVATGAGLVVAGATDDDGSSTVDATTPTVEADTTTTGPESPTTGVEGRVLIPNLVGVQFAQADATLRSLGYEVVVLPDAASDRPAGEVLGQDPAAGSTLPIGGVVSVVVASPAEARIPDVTGLEAVEAAATLARLGLAVERGDEPSETIPEGRITRTDPSAGGSLRVNDRIVLYVSSGLPQAVVPQLVPLNVQAATELITAAGFVPTARPVDLPEDDPQLGRVIAQTPPPGSSAQKGTTIEFTYGRATP